MKTSSRTHTLTATSGEIKVSIDENFNKTLVITTQKGNFEIKGDRDIDALVNMLNALKKKQNDT